VTEADLTKVRLFALGDDAVSKKSFGQLADLFQGDAKMLAPLAKIVGRTVGVRHAHIVALDGEQGERPRRTKLLTKNVHQAHIPHMSEAKTKLDLWMGDARDDVWLSGVVGCTRSQASRIRRGKSLPSLAGAVAIERATKGKVKAADLLEGAANDAHPQERAA
jgi:hypothetical protein